MRQITVAVAQMSPLLNQVDQNLAVMGQMIEEACCRAKIDIIVFPELCTTGYECGVHCAELAGRVNQRSVQAVAELAAECETYAVFGMAERLKVESVACSAAIAVDPEGNVSADY